MDLKGKRVAFLATDGVEESEYTQPREAVEAAGATAELIAPQGGGIQAVQHSEKSRMLPVEKVLKEADPGDYDALVLPGGVANPDKLRMVPEAVQFVKTMFASGKPVAAICHGPWLLVEADVVKGRTLTSYPSLKTDLKNAGAEWIDEKVHVDRGLVTSRNPDDLPAFCDKVVEEIAEGAHRR